MANRFSEETRALVFDKTAGKCTYCDKQLAWKNYGDLGARAAWEIDHSLPVSRGGTDHLNNLVPACIPCNRLKADMTGREYRAKLEAEAPAQGMQTEGIALAAALIAGILLFLKAVTRKQ